jgi:hypothetical protein
MKNIKLQIFFSERKDVTCYWLYNTRWFKYDRDKLWFVYTQIVPVIFEPPCIYNTKNINPIIIIIIIIII